MQQLFAFDGHRLVSKASGEILPLDPIPPGSSDRMINHQRTNVCFGPKDGIGKESLSQILALHYTWAASLLSPKQESFSSTTRFRARKGR